MKSRKNMLIIVLISFCITSFGQITPNKHTKLRLNKIDSLQTDKDVFDFIQQQFPDYKGKKIFNEYINETRQTADSLKVQHWIKIDIDNNGENDIIVFNADKLPNIYAILSLKYKYTAISAPHFYKYQFVYPILGKINNQNVILLYHQEGAGFSNKKKHLYTKLTCDTLIFKENSFLNYVQSPQINDIESVKIYNDGMCEGDCPIINIEINAKTYENKCSKQMYHFYINRKPENLSGQLTELQIKKILSLLDYSNFMDWNENYSVNYTDQTTTTLIITYNNGKTKTIKDYGSSGNFTLKEIYRIAFSIEWNITVQIAFLGLYP